MITPEDVTIAYRLFFGRNPENQHVVNDLCQTVHSISQLRDEFIKSPEFRKIMSAQLDRQDSTRQRHPLDAPFIPVESRVSDEVLSALFKRIDEEWTKLGKTEPYWSVLTQPQYYVDTFSANKDQFFFSGDGLCYLFLSALRRNEINPNLIQTCLEVGSGVGRVTLHLAKKIQKVIATDISRPHLDLLQDRLLEQQVDNVEIMHLDTPTAYEFLPKVDAVFSVITLQHNPPPISAWILRQMFDCLKPGGVAFFQIATYKNGYLFEVSRYQNTEPSNTFEMHFLPQKEVFRIISEAGCTCLEVREDGMVGNEDVMLSNTFLVQKNA